MKRIILFGHVDHGKSTLAGHLLYLTGNVTQHDVDKASQDADNLKMSRWKWAYLLDISAEERAKGKTHEFAVFPFKYKDEEYELIDTPGHQSFVRETIMAIGKYHTADGCLIISAIENEFSSGFERGMTKEQCILARACGIERLIVVINKMDAVGYSLDVVERIKALMEPFLKNKLKFKDVVFLPVSAFEGKNVLEILDHVQERAPGESPRSGDHSDCKKRHVVKAQILKCDNIISPGFVCTAHIAGEEHVVTVEKIKGRCFVKSGMGCEMRISFPHEVCLSETSRIILRTKDYTMGFGTPKKNILHKLVSN